jgi:hypothetical protein
MIGEQVVSVREFLRNFKHYREELTSGNIESIQLPIEGGARLEVKVKSKRNSAKNIADCFRKLPKGIKIGRPQIFKELIRII